MVTDFRARVDRDRVVSRLTKLVQVASENPPGLEAEAAGLVAGWCRDLGGEVSLHEAEPGRPNVIARWRFGDGPVLTYCSHIDVVPAGDRALWGMDPFGAEQLDGRLHGRGSSDAKGPVAASIEAVAALTASASNLRGTLELALVADEEAMGFKGAAFLIEQGLVSTETCIVGEPTSLKVVRAQRGAAWLRIKCNGVAAHGSAPERGINAIRHMAELIDRLEDTLPAIHHPLLGRPTLNVGTIQGGQKVNMVPDLCVIEVDRRTIPGESPDSVLASIHEAVHLAQKRYPDLEAEIELPFFAQPFEVAEGASVTQVTSAVSAEVLSAPEQTIGFRGASDARFFAAAGADVVVWGPGEIALAHTARESIDIRELGEGAVAYAAAFARLLS